MKLLAHKSQSGYLMIEVMVTMVVILIGIVGIAKLQHVAKNSTAQAIQRTLVSDLADNLIERVRSNPDGIANYFPSDSALVLKGVTPTPSKLCTISNSCIPSELATFDLWEWEQTLIGTTEQSLGNNTGGLVNPIVCLQRPPGGGDGIYHIAIVWHGLTKFSENELDLPTIANTNADTCGTAAAYNAYDSVGTNNNTYRRVHWQEIFLDV
jgi:type IV pilus assembly protein PilV